jgi:hypothetical protein
MTTVWIALIAIGAIASLGAGVWLVAIAFRESVGWGIACLFGFPAVVFVVRYWEDVKLPFAYGLAGTAVAAAGLIGYSVSSVNADLVTYHDLDDSYGWETRPVQLPDEPDTTSGFEPETDGDETDLSATDDQPDADPDVEPADAEHMDEPEQQRTPISVAERRRGYLVPFAKLPTYEGERVVITLKNGERVFVRVLEVRELDLEVRRSVGGGSVTFDVRLSEIAEVRSRRAP